MQLSTGGAKREPGSSSSASAIATSRTSATPAEHARAAKGTLSVWKYAVRKAANGDLEQAPLSKVGLIATESLRVEPYATPLKVVPME